jgi:hypothetical protein
MSCEMIRADEWIARVRAEREQADLGSSLTPSEVPQPIVTESTPAPAQRIDFPAVAAPTHPNLLAALQLECQTSAHRAASRLTPTLATATERELLDLLATAWANHAQLLVFLDELHAELSSRRARPSTAA